MDTTERTVTIAQLDRLANSRDGSPRYRVHFGDGTSALTKPDAQVNHLISGYYVGRSVDMEFDQRGQILYMREAMVDRAGIGDMIAARKGAPVSGAYVRKLTSRDDFPAGIAFAIGTIWNRDDVADFLNTPRKPGPKPKDSS